MFMWYILERELNFNNEALIMIEIIRIYYIIRMVHWRVNLGRHPQQVELDSLYLLYYYLFIP